MLCDFGLSEYIKKNSLIIVVDGVSLPPPHHVCVSYVRPSPEQEKYLSFVEVSCISPEAIFLILYAGREQAGSSGASK